MNKTFLTVAQGIRDYFRGTIYFPGWIINLPTRSSIL